MEPWRDFAKFTDAALDAFIRGFTSHNDQASAVLEFHRQRQQNARLASSGKTAVTVAVPAETRADDTMAYHRTGGSVPGQSQRTAFRIAANGNVLTSLFN